MISSRNLATALGISKGTVGNYAAKGMPLDSIEAARAWIAKRPASSPSPSKPAKPAPIPIDTGAIDVEGATLESGMPRLRRLEMATAVALEQALKEGKAFEAASLRKQHLDALKGLYDAEAKLIKINVARGKLVSIDRALSMINGALASAVQVLRRLPELGRDPTERARLEAFMNGVLTEIKLGAAEGFRNI